MPRLYDWQKSETLRQSLEIYDWETSLEKPSADLVERAEGHHQSARTWAIVSGMMIGNNLAAGVGLARAATPAVFMIGMAIYNNAQRFELHDAAHELWPKP